MTLPTYLVVELRRRRQFLGLRQDDRPTAGNDHDHGVDHGVDLGPGWWFGTNNSADETLTWLRRGADLAGLEWGKDITTSIG